MEKAAGFQGSVFQKAKIESLTSRIPLFICLLGNTEALSQLFFKYLITLSQQLQE